MNKYIITLLVASATFNANAMLRAVVTQGRNLRVQPAQNVVLARWVHSGVETEATAKVAPVVTSRTQLPDEEYVSKKEFDSLKWFGAVALVGFFLLDQQDKAIIRSRLQALEVELGIQKGCNVLRLQIDKILTSSVNEKWFEEQKKTQAETQQRIDSFLPLPSESRVQE